MKKYLTEQQINDLTNICKSYFNGKKEKAKAIKKKFGIRITMNRQDNLNQFGDYGRKQLTISNPSEWGKNYNDLKKENFYDADNKFLYPFLVDNCGDDWNWVCSYDLEKFFQENIYPDIKLLGDTYQGADLMSIDDYFSYWNKYSIENVDAEYINTTKKISDTLNKLLNDLNKSFPDKEYHINTALKNFLTYRDEQKLYNYLADVDFWGVEQNRKIQEEKVKSEEGRLLNIKLLKEKISNEMIKEVNLTDMKLSNIIDEEVFNINSKNIKDRIEAYNLELNRLK